jgi:hypothetical protein
LDFEATKMRRTLAVVAVLIGCLPAPFARAQDGRQVLEGILGGVLTEIERRQQQRREKKLARQLEPLWTACAAGDVPACHAAAQFPLNDQARALLHNNLQRAVAQREAYDRNSSACERGSVEGCDAALSYPFATDHDALANWRHAAIERQRQWREAENRDRERIAAVIARCHAGDVASCDQALGSLALNADQLAQISARRAIILSRQTTSKDTADTTQSPQRHPRQAARPPTATVPVRAPAAQSSSASDSTTAFMVLFAALLAAAFFMIKWRELPLPHLPLAARLSFLFRPTRRRQEAAVMRDDRDALVGALRPAFAGPQPHPRSQHMRVMQPGQDNMKVKIRRDQVTGMTGKVTFTVNFIAELSPEARNAVKRYRFGNTVLYAKDPKLDPTINIFRLLWRLVWLRFTRKRWQINVNDLVNGRTIQCKDILEVLDTEERVMGAAKSFASVLRAASWFGGEEIVAL